MNCVFIKDSFKSVNTVFISFRWMVELSAL